jgi:hypothetical protein
MFACSSTAFISRNLMYDGFKRTCRSSPFFWAFQEGLVQDRDMAGAIFKFTDAIPGADIGKCMQRVDCRTGALISEVDMTVFPGISGVVVTTSSIAGVRRSSLHTCLCVSSLHACVYMRSAILTQMWGTDPWGCSAGSGLTVDVTVLDTRVENSVFAQLLDNIVVPVKQLVERARGEGTTRTTVQVLYVDETMRVMQTPDGHYFVYGRPS